MENLNTTFDGELYRDKNNNVVTKKEMKKLLDEQAYNRQFEYYEGHQELNIEPKYDLKERSKGEVTRRSVKTGYPFNMGHTTDINKLMLSGELDVYEKAFISTFFGCITYPDNCIKVNNKFLYYKELMTLIPCSKNIMSRVINGLQDKDIIYVVEGANVPPIIYVNPFLYASGRDITIPVCDLFENSIYYK